MTMPIPENPRPTLAVRLLAGFPVALAAVMWVVFWFDATHAFGMSLIRSEFGPVELATFAAYMTAGFVGLAATRFAARRGLPRHVVVLMVVFSAGMLFAGMEEVSWGQTFFGFASPAGWAKVNDQGELNVHNLEGIQDLHSFLLLTIGLSGLLAARYFVRRRLEVLRVPAFVMPYLVTITVLAALDYLTDTYPLSNRFDVVTGNLAEINEMLIGIAGSIYAICVFRRLRDDGAVAGAAAGARLDDPSTRGSAGSRGPTAPHRP